jgi:hypothetical protein
MKEELGKFWILLITTFFLILFSNVIFSDSSNPFTTPRTCNDTFGFNCGNQTGNGTANYYGLNDAFLGCDGTQYQNTEYVNQAYLNATSVFFGDAINATCEFYQQGTFNQSEYIWYNNDTSNSNWLLLYSMIDNKTSGTYNRSVVFVPNSSEGTQIVRCIITANFSSGKSSAMPSNAYCANSTTQSTSGGWDNDDVNFTVTSHLTYSFWNLTNYTNGATIPDGTNLTRNDLINVSANWSKVINNANITHNGTGSLVNYTVCTLPNCIGNWTNYTLNLSNAAEFNTTGLINVSYIWANDTYSATNSTSPSHYFYLWGFSKVDQIGLNQSTIYNGSSVLAFCKIIDNITNLPINNYNVSFYRNDSFLNSSLTNSSGYANVSFVDNIVNPPRNYTIKCNITDASNLYYNASSQNYNTTNITVLNPYELQVGNFWFNYSGIRTNNTNLFTNLTIYANVSDAWQVSGVYANFSYPNGAIINLSMSGDNTSAGWNLWNYTFNNSQYPLNATGTYTVRIIANNSNRVENVSDFKTFNVTNNYTLNLTSNYSVYMRGENVTIQALDVNSNIESSVNWTANVTKINATYNFTPQATTFNYTILPSDIEGNYSIIVNASKNNNTGNNSWNFNVSRTLYLVISTTTTLSPGNTLNISVNLYNARGELYANFVNTNITCPNGMKSLSFSSGHASTLECTAPDSYSASFNITVNATDSYNNTGENYTTLTTTSAPSSGGGGGGGGSSGFASETKKCSDKTLYNQCSSQWPLYCSNGTLINKCSICGCNNTDYGCQPDGSCTLVKKEDFDLETNITSIEIRQGEDKELVIGILKNTGNTILNLKTFLNVSQDCCNISIPPIIVLKEKEEKEFSLVIHVPLSTNVSEYLTSIGVGTSTFKKERSLTVAVTKSPYYASLEEIVAELSDIEKEIQDYKKAGVDVRSLEDKIEQTKLELYNANNSISTDQLNALTGYISDMSGNVNYVQTELSSIRTRIFFSQVTWLVLLLIISSFLTTYMVPEVLMPLYKTGNEIRKLKEEEKILVSSRLETEKQYFLRKMDEKTFSNIMIGKQDKILKTRATIKEKEDESKKIIEDRLKPKGIARTIKEKFDKVFKKKNEK